MTPTGRRQCGISAAIYRALPFDPVKDFAMISTISSFDLVLATDARFRVSRRAPFG
jgi:hypothetical protein